MCVHGGDTCVLILHGSMFLFVLSQAIAGPEKLVDRYEANAFYEFCLSSPEAHLVIVFSFKDNRDVATLVSLSLLCFITSCND